MSPNKTDERVYWNSNTETLRLGESAIILLPQSQGIDPGNLRRSGMSSSPLRWSISAYSVLPQDHTTNYEGGKKERKKYFLTAGKPPWPQTKAERRARSSHASKMILSPHPSLAWCFQRRRKQTQTRWSTKTSNILTTKPNRHNPERHNAQTDVRTS